MEESFIKNLLSENGRMEKVVEIALKICLYEVGNNKIGSITLEEMKHIYNMLRYKEPMKQLGINKDYWELTEDEIVEINLQIARNNGYEV